MHLEGDSELFLETKLSYWPTLHEMLQGQIKRGRHMNLRWIEDET